MSNVHEVILLSIKEIDCVIELINEKINNIDKEIKFDIDILVLAMDNLYKSFQDIANIKKNEILELDKKIKKISVLIKGSIGLEIIKNNDINDYLKLLNQTEDEIQAATKNNDILNKEIEELKKKESNKADFADHMNKILINLEIELKLELFNENYLIKHSIIDKKLRIEDISEGEQNLLTLLYFYCELFSDAEQLLIKPEIELIVIDDSISSIDRVNSIYLLSLIKNIFNNKKYKHQIFVLTHVWENFCNLSYGKNKVMNSCFEVKKNNDSSYIEKIDKIVDPYKHEFKEIYEFSKLSTNDKLDEYQIYHYPNVMKKILEFFLRFKHHSEIFATRTNIGPITQILCGDKPSNIQKQKIEVLLNICNIYLHKIVKNSNEKNRRNW